MKPLELLQDAAKNYGKAEADLTSALSAGIPTMLAISLQQNIDDAQENLLRAADAYYLDTYDGAEG